MGSVGANCACVSLASAEAVGISSAPRGTQWRREGCQAPVKKKETMKRPNPS